MRNINQSSVAQELDGLASRFLKKNCAKPLPGFYPERKYRRDGQLQRDEPSVLAGKKIRMMALDDPDLKPLRVKISEI